MFFFDSINFFYTFAKKRYAICMKSGESASDVKICGFGKYSVYCKNYCLTVKGIAY